MVVHALAALPMTLLGLVSMAAGCVRTGGGSERPERVIELRGPDGSLNLLLELFSTRADWRTFEAVAARGTLRAEASAMIAGEDVPSALALRSTSEGGLEAQDASGLRWSLVRQDGILRMGDPAGFPRARIQCSGEVATLHAASGVVVGGARSEGGRVVLSDRDGKTLGFVTGTSDIERAVLLLEPGLQPVERALILAVPYWPKPDQI